MAELGNAVKDLLTKLLENIPKEQVADKIKGFFTDTLKIEIGDVEGFKTTINQFLEGDSETAMDSIANYITGLINQATTESHRGPSYQSSRIYYKGKDHKDIYYQGNWHLALYLLKESWHCDGYEWMKLHDPEFLDTYDIWMQSYPDLVDHSHEHLMRCEWTGEEKFYPYDLSNETTSFNLEGDILNMDLCRSNSFSKVSFLTSEWYTGNVGFQLIQNERGYYRGYTPFNNSGNAYEDINSPLGKKDMYACVYSDNDQDIWVPRTTNPYELQIFSSMHGAKPSYKNIVNLPQQVAVGGGVSLEETMPICQNVGYSVFATRAGIFSTNGTIVKALHVGQCDDYDTANYPIRNGLVPRELSLPGSSSLINRINEIENKYKPDGILSNYMPFTSAFYDSEYGGREELCLPIEEDCKGTTYDRNRTSVNIYWQDGMFQHNGCGYVPGSIRYGYRMKFETWELAEEEQNRINEAIKNMWINIHAYRDSYRGTWVTVIIEVPVYFKYGEDGISDVWDYVSELSRLGLLETKTYNNVLYKSSSKIFVLSKHNMLYCFYSPWILWGGEDAPDAWKPYLKTYALKVPFDSDRMELDDYYGYGTEIHFRALDDTGKPISMIFNGLLPGAYAGGTAADRQHGIRSIDWESDDISIRFSDLYPLKSCNLVAAYNGSDPRYKYYIFNKSDSAYFSVRSDDDTETYHPLCLNAPVIRLDSPSAFASGVVWKGSNTTHVKDESEGGIVNE